MDRSLVCTPFRLETRMTTTRILALAGSQRTGSYNRRLLQIAVAGAQVAGAEVTVVEMREFPLPLYDPDLEAAHGLPDLVLKLKDLFLTHQGLLIASPEYNSAVTPVLKNTIDWVSRAAPGETPLACFKGKVAGLLAASPGALGGLRGLASLRTILGNIQVLVLPAQIAIAKAHEAFAEGEALKDSKQDQAVRAIAAEVVQIAGKLAG
jgi:NAD(P)H-dependent FMN reductase